VKPNVAARRPTSLVENPISTPRCSSVEQRLRRRPRLPAPRPAFRRGAVVCYAFAAAAGAGDRRRRDYRPQASSKTGPGMALRQPGSTFKLVHLPWPPLQKGQAPAAAFAAMPSPGQVRHSPVLPGQTFSLVGQPSPVSSKHRRLTPAQAGGGSKRLKADAPKTWASAPPLEAVPGPGASVRASVRLIELHRRPTGPVAKWRKSAHAPSTIRRLTERPKNLRRLERCPLALSAQEAPESGDQPGQAPCSNPSMPSRCRVAAQRS